MLLLKLWNYPKKNENCKTPVLGITELVVLENHVTVDEWYAF
jgi:hypothetical protein